MKFNFKKVVSVLATTAMLGSTVAFAAAAYPAPFVSNGAADAAIIVGSNQDATDMAAALDLQTSLNAGVTATGSTTVDGSGDKIQITKSSDKLNLGNTLTDVWGTSITKSDLKTILADGVFYNKQNTEYKYNQKFDVGALNFTHFSDSDYNNRVPTLGFKLNANTFVANYTLDFVTDPESTSSSGELTDFENKNVDILGKNYYILDFKNSTSKLTLLDAATSATISEGESKTLTISDKPYKVSINFISTDEVILTVNDVNTEKLSATGTTYGNTYKLPDGTYVGVKTINVQNYAGGTKSVEFSIGKGKLEITSGNNVKINDKTIDDLYGYITFGSSSGKATWQKLVMKWQIQDEAFLTPGKELVMPGFEAIKFTMADTTIPAKEVTMIDYGSNDYVELKTTIKSGDVTIPLLYIETQTGNFSGIGKSATEKLATTNNAFLIYNATSSSAAQNEGFVASWNSSREAETYYLKATVRYDSDAGRNLVTIKDKVTSDTLCEDLDTNSSSAPTCTIGNVILTVNNASYSAGGDRIATMTINSGGSFNRVYTKEGMTIYLPYASATTAQNGGTKGAINISSANESSFLVALSEEDKDGNLGKKDFSATVSSGGSAGSKKITVSSVTAGTQYETETSSKVWESYIVSDLATKVIQDKTNSDQYSVEVDYAGGEVYANVYVAAPSVATTSAGKIQVFKDTEAATSAKDKNLIVVGGSCINTVARLMVDAAATAPICGADFSAKTSVVAGGYIIKVAASPLNSGKIAMLVAGYNAADTKKAADKVKEGTVDTSKNGQIVYPVAGTTA
jgi:hypothetical protein